MRGLTSRREVGEHVVVTFVLERHPDDASGRGGQQQRAERAVDRAVGDVEQAAPVGALDEPVVETAEDVVVRLRERRRQLVDEAGVGGHAGAPSR